MKFFSLLQNQTILNGYEEEKNKEDFKSKAKMTSKSDDADDEDD